MIWNADLLGRLGLTSNLYYFILLPMGLAAAGFLFGILRSYALYSGKKRGRILELSGPVVAFLLVLWSTGGTSVVQIGQLGYHRTVMAGRSATMEDQLRRIF